MYTDTPPPILLSTSQKIWFLIVVFFVFAINLRFLETWHLVFDLVLEGVYYMPTWEYTQTNRYVVQSCTESRIDTEQ